MKLTPEEMERFDEQGYLFFPSRFSADEAAVLRAAADEVYALDRDEVWRESSGVARTAFAAHTYNEAFRRLGRHPRLVEPVMQLVDGPVYMHQYKVNANGPLLFLPGSHRQGVFEAGHDLETTSYPLWTLDRATVTRLAERGGCVAPTGPPGSIIVFASTLVHASPPNISPFGRSIVYLSLCHVDNHIRRFKRAAWIAHRDFTPIEPLADDCLAELARAGAAAV